MYTDIGAPLKHSRSGEGGDVQSWGYLGSLAQVMVDSLNRRMVAGEAQTSESCASVIVGVAVMKLDSGR